MTIAAFCLRAFGASQKIGIIPVTPDLSAEIDGKPLGGLMLRETPVGILGNLPDFADKKLIFHFRGKGVPFLERDRRRTIGQPCKVRVDSVLAHGRPSL